MEINQMTFTLDEIEHAGEKIKVGRPVMNKMGQIYVLEKILGSGHFVVNGNVESKNNFLPLVKTVKGLEVGDKVFISKVGRMGKVHALTPRSAIVTYRPHGWSFKKKMHLFTLGELQKAL